MLVSKEEPVGALGMLTNEKRWPPQFRWGVGGGGRSSVFLRCSALGPKKNQTNIKNREPDSIAATACKNGFQRSHKEGENKKELLCVKKASDYNIFPHSVFPKRSNIQKLESV